MQIIYLNKEDRKHSCIAKDVALNVSNKLMPLADEIKKEKAGIFIHFGNGHSKIEIKASPKLAQAISRIL